MRLSFHIVRVLRRVLIVPRQSPCRVHALYSGGMGETRNSVYKIPDDSY
jgi:hypothetical protein